jgi:hypothetical protein
MLKLGLMGSQLHCAPRLFGAHKVIYAIAGLLVAVIFVTGSNYLLKTRGRRPLILITLVLTGLILALGHWYPIFATNYLRGRAFAFYRTDFVAYSLCGVVASFLALSALAIPKRTRIIVSTIVGFLIAWCGQFVT